MSDLYLRDLNGILRKEVEAEIRKDRPDLVAILDNEDEEKDIIVGELFRKEKYEVVK